ncbi:hypothetical protein ACU8KH_04496 [Lachancea thermotolerans]
MYYCSLRQYVFKTLCKNPKKRGGHYFCRYLTQILKIYPMLVFERSFIAFKIFHHANAPFIHALEKILLLGIPF